MKNYVDLLTNPTTWALYLSTIKFTLIVLAITFVLGFWIAYFLVFHVRNLLVAIGLFLVCTVPFWTSNIIRMISWRPVLGKEGLINSALLNAGIIDQPLQWLLYSDFSVVVAYVHLFTLFMIVPIFNSMARIDKSLLEAAVDAGATRWGAVWNVVLPLSKTGIALGTLFVVTLTMGDFFVVTVMSRRALRLGHLGHVQRPADPELSARRRQRGGAADRRSADRRVDLPPRRCPQGTGEIAWPSAVQPTGRGRGPSTSSRPCSRCSSSSSTGR